jgi:hypothetical protein
MTSRAIPVTPMAFDMNRNRFRHASMPGIALRTGLPLLSAWDRPPSPEEGGDIEGSTVGSDA